MCIYKISKRDKITVSYKEWSMDFFDTGDYVIYKNNKGYTHGKYDPVIADSYISEMSAEDKIENLTNDLKSWVAKAIDKKVSL